MVPVHPRISVEYRKEAAVVSFTDEKILEERDILALQNSIMSVVDQSEIPILILDFSKVAFLSSAVLGLLIRLSKKIYEKNGDLLLCNIAPKIYEIFKITKLTGVFNIFIDVDAALDSLEQQS